MDNEWKVGSWLSAALDDDSVCDEMKTDIRAWFDGNGHLQAAPAPSLLAGGEVKTLRTLLDNLVIAQGLSKEIRTHATDEARAYLYDTRLAALSPEAPARAGDGS